MSLVSSLEHCPLVCEFPSVSSGPSGSFCLPILSVSGSVFNISSQFIQVRSVLSINTIKEYSNQLTHTLFTQSSIKFYKSLAPEHSDTLTHRACIHEDFCYLSRTLLSKAIFKLSISYISRKAEHLTHNRFLLVLMNHSLVKLSVIRASTNLEIHVVQTIDSHVLKI